MPYAALLHTALLYAATASYDEALESLSVNKAKRRREVVEKSKRAQCVAAAFPPWRLLMRRCCRAHDGESPAELARKAMQELASAGRCGAAAAAGGAGE